MSERRAGFADFIEALTIFDKYVDEYAGTHCEHDILTICGVEPHDVSLEDRRRLAELGFKCNFEVEDGDIPNPDDDEDCFTSFRWGSC